MTYNEAAEIVRIAPARTDKPSKINPGMTMADAVKIVWECVWEGIELGKSTETLPDWLEKRVRQVQFNQMRPSILRKP